VAGAWRWPPTPLTPRLKIEWSCTSTPPLGLRGLLIGWTLPHWTSRPVRNAEWLGTLAKCLCRPTSWFVFHCSRAARLPLVVL